MPDIKLGSLFDGIGVFPLAASRCGIRPVWASEIEKAPISITKRHFPDMAHLGDITKVDGGKIPPVHVITFGSPCQNLSLIGNRSGLAGAKSSLFYQAFRIIQEMRDATDNLYPAIAVWENVMGAFSTNDRMDFRAVLKEEWTAGELLSIPEEKRRAIGIRAADLHHIEVDIPPTKEKDMTLEVKDLTFSYRKHPVFHDISFRAYAGDLIAIVGHNGIGKTTLSNILCGMQKEKEGQVIYNGTKVSKGKRKNFAYFVMQNTDCQLFGDSVEEELLLNGKGSTQEQRDDLLKLYGLFEWKERHPATLSGGQKQRLALAVSDWIDTPVLILDEPTSGLDFKNMMRISEHLKALAQKGKTILIITHDYEFAAMTCNRVLHFVDEGHVETFPLQENLSRLYSCLMCQ